jgi:DNA-directed RNA polymerase specialized sigma24 family protein
MDEASFHDFVQERWPALVRFAWTLAGNRHRAEDIVQVVLERAWPRWRTIDPRGAYADVRAAVVHEADLSWPAAGA